VAVYRDGCKLTQPISTSLTDMGRKEKGIGWGQRKKLATTRKSLTHKFDLQGFEGYLTVGLYEDGLVAEIFIRMAKQGSTLSGILEAWAIAVSLGLQHGVPLETFVDKYQDMKFEPAGFTGDEDIRIAKSIADYIFRWLDIHFGASKMPAVLESSVEERRPVVQTSQNADGPPCTKCGNMTKRSGTCYLCMSCGTTTGCS
jgi:ribonucleoside-diphosphate reductase alpha chain